MNDLFNMPFLVFSDWWTNRKWILVIYLNSNTLNMIMQFNMKMCFSFSSSGQNWTKFYVRRETCFIKDGARRLQDQSKAWIRKGWSIAILFIFFYILIVRHRNNKNSFLGVSQNYYYFTFIASSTINTLPIRHKTLFNQSIHRIPMHDGKVW